MASYRIEWKQSARKELRKQQKLEIVRILSAVEGLADARVDVSTTPAVEAIAERTGVREGGAEIYREVQ